MSEGVRLVEVCVVMCECVRLVEVCVVMCEDVRLVKVCCVQCANLYGLICEGVTLVKTLDVIVMM